MDKIKVLWSGITGRTAKEVLKVVENSDLVEIVAGICRNDSHFYHYDELEQITEEFDIIIDFSHKNSFNKMLDYALEKKKPMIIGTSGLSSNQVKKIEEASAIIPIFRGGNFRFEVKDFIDQILEYSKLCKKKKLELIEIHYKTMKIPSETAKVIRNRVVEETGKQLEIKSFLQDREDTNDWRVDDFHYQCRVYDEKLANDILSIAVMMKDKSPYGIYDLDRLLRKE